MKFRRQHKYFDIGHYYLRYARKKYVRKVSTTVESWVDKVEERAAAVAAVSFTQTYAAEGTNKNSDITEYDLNA